MNPELSSLSAFTKSYIIPNSFEAFLSKLQSAIIFPSSFNKNYCAVLAAITLAILVTSCQQPSKPATDQKSIAQEKHAPAIPVAPKPLFDTTGLAEAPIKILSAELSSKLIDTFDNKEDNLKHDGHFKRFISLNVKYKNVSSKRIVGARLRWLIVDKNDKPTPVADERSGLQMGYMGTLANVDLGGFTFAIGETKTDTWTYDSEAGEKIKIAFVSEVQFYDDTIWKIGKHQ